MTLFKNKYRIESTRLKEWDYSNAGWYYITICTKDKICWFGKILNGELESNDIGKLVKGCWQEIPKQFLNVDIDKYVIMPNHIHGIIIINDYKCRDAINCVSTTIEKKAGGFAGYKNPQLTEYSL
ncbi:MAG: hypothetical protein QME25_08860 [Bacteroidota bacterium]|nr:hypothetical protein [Bacteroidota bacterium]